MKLFCYFVEPASYTIDLAKNIYDKNKIEYCFINSYSLAKSYIRPHKTYLDKLPLIAKLKFIISVYKENDLIIINGYNNYPFIMTFILNIFSFNKKYIAIESDSQLLFSKNLLKRLVKWVYLSIIFNNKNVLGFAGGSIRHKDLFRNYGMQEKRIFLMPMLVDNSKFLQYKKKFPELFTFLYVGRLVEHKNVEALIKQFNKNFNKVDLLRVVY